MDRQSPSTEPGAGQNETNTTIKQSNKQTNKLCIVPHLGLGDMIILNGLVRDACEAHDEVLLFVKKAYISSIRSLFGDVTNLRLKFVAEAHEFTAELFRSTAAMGYDMMFLGQHSGTRWRALDPLWSRALYRQAGLDPARMYTGFRVARHPDREAAMLEAVRRAVGDVYVVVHDDAARGFVIRTSSLPPGMPVVHVDDPRWRTANIFDYAAVIDNAIQFHGFDSCFMLMADFLGVKARTFCHAYFKDPALDQAFYRTNVTIIREPI